MLNAAFFQKKKKKEKALSFPDYPSKLWATSAESNILTSL